MAGLSPGYRRYMRSARWREAKRRHWESPITLKSCVVCGARRHSRMDMHHLRYRTRRDGNLIDPRPWDLVPACSRPCHRWIITPLSRTPFVRAALFLGLGALSVYLGAPLLWVAVAVVIAIALPRIPEATFLAFVLGLPVRLARYASRLVLLVFHILNSLRR